MKLTATSKRDRRGELTRELTYQKVLLAVYMLTDAEGVACDSTVARIAGECGHSIQAVQRSIGVMIERGVVLTLAHRDGLNRRILIIADHPKAHEFIASVKGRIDAKFREETDRRAARANGGSH